MARKPTSSKTETEVLLRSRRRCAICYGLSQDTKVKHGQIAHIDKDNHNSKPENLVFLCLDHHNEYDSKTSQSKGITEKELRRFREELDAYVKTELRIAWPDYPSSSKGVDTPERPKLNIEVYDRKIQIYRTVRDFLGVILTEATVTIEQLRQFARETDEAIFLFDLDLAEYLREIYKKAVRLRYIDKRLADQRLPVGDERSRLDDEEADLLNWLSDQFEVSRGHFYKYIALR